MLRIFENLSLPLPVVGALIGLFGVWIGSWLASRRAHDDRIWQRKAEAYGKILEALNIMMWSYDDDQRDIENCVQRDPEHHKKRNEDYDLWKRQLFSTVAREVWLLPISVKAETDSLAKALNASHEIYNDYVDSCATEIQKSVERVEALARVDLKRKALLGFFTR
jgi:hypothetical protein